MGKYCNLSLMFTNILEESWRINDQFFYLMYVFRLLKSLDGCKVLWSKVKSAIVFHKSLRCPQWIGPCSQTMVALGICLKTLWRTADSFKPFPTFDLSCGLLCGWIVGKTSINLAKSVCKEQHFKVPLYLWTSCNWCFSHSSWLLYWLCVARIFWGVGRGVCLQGWLL